MEHRIPIRYDQMEQPLPIAKTDLILFCIRMERLEDEVAARLACEVLAAVYQVESLVEEVRSIDREIWRLNKALKHWYSSSRPLKAEQVRGELETLHWKRVALQCHAMLLLEALRRPTSRRRSKSNGRLTRSCKTQNDVIRPTRFYFPRTWHNISRKLVRIASKKRPKSCDFLQNSVVRENFGSALCEPGVNRDAVITGNLDSSLQLIQDQAKIDLSASFWDDKQTVLRKFITEGKI